MRVIYPTELKQHGGRHQTALRAVWVCAGTI